MIMTLCYLALRAVDDYVLVSGKAAVGDCVVIVR